MSMSFYPATFDGQRYSYLEGMPDLNFSNSNSYGIISALGFPLDHDSCPTWEIGEFIHACELFFQSEIADYIDQGRPVTEYKLEDHATIIDCWRRAGYLTEKISLLWHSAKLGQSQGATHCYFA